MFVFVNSALTALEFITLVSTSTLIKNTLNSETKQVLVCPKLFASNNLNFFCNRSLTFYSITGLFLVIIKLIIATSMTKRLYYFLSDLAAEQSGLLWKDILNLENEYLKKFKKEKLAFSVTNGITAIYVSAIGSIVLAANDLFLMLLFVVLLFKINLLYTLVLILLFAIISVLLHRNITLKSKKLNFDNSELYIGSNTLIAEGLANRREIYLNQEQAVWVKKLVKLRKKYSITTANLSLMPTMTKYIYESLFFIFVITIGFLSIYMPVKMTQVDFGVFILCLLRIIPSLLRVQQGVLSVASTQGVARISLELFNEINSKLIKVPNVNTQILSQVKNKNRNFISLEKVSFKYSDSAEFLLKDVSFNVEKGEVIAISGNSGSGKSTLIDLLIGYLKPTSGHVYVKGVYPEELVKSKQIKIALVSQDFYINDENLLKNLSHENIDDSELQRILEFSKLKDRFMSEEVVAEFHLGEDGNKLSGGLRQRVAIARMFARNADLVILDEATSAIDPNTEYLILSNLLNLETKPTIIIVSHNINILKRADKVLFLQNGELNSHGNFDYLSKNNPEFINTFKIED